MSISTEKRRQFIRTGLAVSLLGEAVAQDVLAGQGHKIMSTPFTVPRRIQEELEKLYGDEANSINHTDRISIKMPEIAENAAVIPISVRGEKGLVSSVAILVEENAKPLTGVFTLHEGTDLTVSTRIKAAKSSAVYVVARTNNGLLGVMRRLKVTMGCMGG